MAFPPIQILRKREPPQSSDHRDHKRQHRGKLSKLLRGTMDGDFHIRPICCWNQPRICGSTRPQIQACFPAASNALALSGGNGVFTATQTERITHYTLRAKSCAKGQAPLETPDNKTGWISRTFPVLDTQPLFVVSSPFLGLPFVSLSIMFPYTFRLANSYARTGSYP